MKKLRVLTILTIALTCATGTTARADTTNTTNRTIPAVYKILLGGIAELSVQITTSYLWNHELSGPENILSFKELSICAITIGFPEKWRLISVSHGKIDGCYLVTMEMVDYSGGKYLRTFVLNLKREDFLEFAAKEHRHVFKRGIKSGTVVLDEDLMLIWEPQPPERSAKAN